MVVNYAVPFIVFVLFLVSGVYLLYQHNQPEQVATNLSGESVIDANDTPSDSVDTFDHPFSIAYMRKMQYPGSEITIEQKLTNGSNYNRYIASYYSDSLKQYGLLTIPNGQTPEDGWPAIVFNHGYISPEVYQTTQRYVAYQDGFARNGYLTYKIDYRGNGNSEGEPRGGQDWPDYTIDVLNAFSSLKKDDRVNPERIGMWGHSMGASLMIRAMLIEPGIKAGVSWAGVVGSFEQIPRRWYQSLYQTYGEPTDNDFWRSISPLYNLSDISGPVQLHHAREDESVDAVMSETFHRKMQEAGKVSQLYIYQGDNHNLSVNFQTAIIRSVSFFDTFLK